MPNNSRYDPRILALYDGYAHGTLSRREFLRKAAEFTAAGTTAAALLASLSPNYALAQQVAADHDELYIDYKKYASPKGAGVMRGYFTRPKVIAHRLPAIVVIHENRGLNPYIEDVARRLAMAGFIAFAPDALTPLGGYPGNDDDGRVLQRQRDRDEMVEDFLAALEFVDKHPDSSGRVGAVGFCFGGGMSMRLAVLSERLDAAVAYYGRHPEPADAARIGIPLMLHHAGLDERVNASWPPFEEALKDAGVEYVNHHYDDVNHGFHNDTTPRFDKDAAALSWQRTVAFFEQQLAS